MAKAAEPATATKQRRSPPPPAERAGHGKNPATTRKSFSAPTATCC